MKNEKVAKGRIIGLAGPCLFAAVFKVSHYYQFITSAVGLEGSVVAVVANVGSPGHLFLYFFLGFGKV